MNKKKLCLTKLVKLSHYQEIFLSTHRKEFNILVCVKILACVLCSQYNVIIFF